ncbi:hypothetical protein DFH29DRAFT_874812 [Suillus ampliporus]|nr:hypothetical protein DFH29DRAFT_874812 [Suillus ampliporus]
MGNQLNLETLLTQAVKIHHKPLLDPRNHALLQRQSLMTTSCETSLVNSEPQCLTPSTSLLLVSATASLLDAQASPPNASDALGTSPATTCALTPVCASEHDTSPLVPTSALHRNPYGSDVAAAEVREDDQDEDKEMLDEFADVCEDEDLEHDPVNCGLAPDPDLAATVKQKVRSTMPTWLASEYQNLRERLVCKMRSNSSHLPMCYDHHTFFDGAENAFLVAGSTFQLTPGLFHQPRFFVWLPHLLVDRIPCPSCLKAGCQVTRGSRVYLQKHGFANQP